jgi:hypothetical protein
MPVSSNAGSFNRYIVVPIAVNSRSRSLVLPTLALLPVLPAGPFAQDAPGPKNAALHLELPAVRTRIGEEFQARLQIHTEAPVGVFALRLEVAPQQVRIRSWSFGEGLERHIALHGEPPACDIIVYPDQSRMFVVMVMDPPFSSQEYGSDGLAVDFTVETAAPSITCILYSGETPDYEPGDDLLALISSLGAARRCAPVTILDSPRLLRGDADGDGGLSLTDAVRVLEFLFLSRELECADAADSNDDGTVSLSDCVLVLRVLFQGAAPPWTSCSSDRTEDALPDCEGSTCRPE